MFWQSHRGVLEPKPVERGVTSPPGMGLPYCFCWALPLGGGGGGGPQGTCLNAKDGCRFQRAVAGTWSAVLPVGGAWEAHSQGLYLGGSRRGDRTLGNHLSRGRTSSTQGTLRRPGGPLPPPAPKCPSSIQPLQSMLAFT